MTLLLLLLSAGPAGADCRSAACPHAEERDAAAADAAALRARRTGHGGLRPSASGGTGLNARGNGLGLRTPAGLRGGSAASGWRAG